MPLSPFQSAIAKAHPIPLSHACVESFWDGTRSGTAEQCLRAACLSHEVFREHCHGHEGIRNAVSQQLHDVADELERDGNPDEVSGFVSRLRNAAVVLACEETL